MNLKKKFADVLLKHGWRRRRNNMWLHPVFRGAKGQSPLFTEADAVKTTLASQTLGKKS